MGVSDALCGRERGLSGERHGYFCFMRLGLPDGTCLEMQEVRGLGSGNVPLKAPFPGHEGTFQPGEKELGLGPGPGSVAALWQARWSSPTSPFSEGKDVHSSPKCRFFRRWSEVLRSMEITGMSKEIENKMRECHGGVGGGVGSEGEEGAPEVARGAAISAL